MTFAIPAPMTFRSSAAPTRRAGKRCAGTSKAANPHGGKAVTFVGSIKAESWNGTLQSPANVGHDRKASQGAVAEKRCGSLHVVQQVRRVSVRRGGHNHGAIMA